MNRITLRSRIGADGVLHVSVPVGAAEANREVQITIEPKGAASKTQQEYWDFLDATAGVWQGDFERPDQGEYEERDPLP